ncbi:MAG: hypothetical protein JNK85_23935 [Verrucomicrobiales bacterium]|nr:hypothetical protein [Verrucomicrobiales bacterium]
MQIKRINPDTAAKPATRNTRGPVTQVNPTPPPLSDFSLASLTTQRIDANLVGQLGYGPLLQGKVVTSTTFLLVEYLVKAWTVQAFTSDNSSQITGQGWVMGVQGIVAAASVDANVTANLAVVAANAQFNASFASCMFMILGMNNAIQNKLIGVLPTAADGFTSDTLTSLGAAGEIINSGLIANAQNPDPNDPLKPVQRYVTDNLPDFAYTPPPTPSAPSSYLDLSAGYAVQRFSGMPWTYKHLFPQSFNSALTTLDSQNNAVIYGNTPFGFVSPVRMAAIYLNLLNRFSPNPTIAYLTPPADITLANYIYNPV